MEERDVVHRYAAIVGAVAGRGDLDPAIDDLHRLPADTPGRAVLAAGLVEAIVRAGHLPGPSRARAIEGLLRVAETDPPTGAQWTRIRGAAAVTTLVRRVLDEDLGAVGEALARLDEIERDGGDDPALRPLLDSARSALRLARAAHEGDSRAIHGLLDDLPEAARTGDTGRMLTEAAGLMAAHERGENVLPDMLGLLSSVRAGTADDSVRAAADEALAGLAPIAAMMSGAPPAAAPAAAPAGTPLRHSAAGQAALGLGKETDLGRVDAGIGHLRRALDLAGTGHPQRVLHLTGLATGLMRRSELTNDPAGQREARALLTEARELAGGPRHPQWQMVNEMLSDVGRLLADHPDSHRLGIEGLRANAWKALIQPDLRGVTAAVRDAARQAVDVARSCLVAGDPAGALTALDAGRGLALFAATEARHITDRLTAAGAAELVVRWRSARDPDPELRREVMDVLLTHAPAAKILDPPGYAEIQQALRDVDADALVYLVPGTGSQPGNAVIAAADGPPSYLALPYLTLGAGTDLERYLVTAAPRDAAAAEPGGDADLAGSLEKLCEWAWDAAMGPLIETYLPRLPRPERRPYRIVLVPMGELARVPWHAARRSDGRFAVELTAISQAVSARMLCRSAVLPGIPVSPTGLIVGDPEAVLPAARLEAYAIRQAFYPGARFVGAGAASGPGTVDEVRDWLTRPGAARGSVLHLACHGYVGTEGDLPTAFLVLAGGARLHAGELVALMTRPVGLVVLAACRTGLSMNGYDEAYSLGTAFLAGGARSVLSTQWRVPDDATSVLMFMFHHFLRAGRQPVWAALRDAQLWMLSEHRSVPEDMPAALRAQLPAACTREVVAWAAFVHGGR